MSRAKGPVEGEPALRDAIANASYDYDEALMDYQGALTGTDADKRAAAETRLRDATERLSAAQTALVTARTQGRSPGISFDQLLRDPTQQLDPTGQVMASVLAYRGAAHATASGAPAYVDRTPPATRTAVYVYERVTASTAIATAS